MYPMSTQRFTSKLSPCVQILTGYDKSSGIEDFTSVFPNGSRRSKANRPSARPESLPMFAEYGESRAFYESHKSD